MRRACRSLSTFEHVPQMGGTQPSMTPPRPQPKPALPTCGPEPHITHNDSMRPKDSTQTPHKTLNSRPSTTKPALNDPASTPPGSPPQLHRVQTALNPTSHAALNNNLPHGLPPPPSSTHPASPLHNTCHTHTKHTPQHSHEPFLDLHLVMGEEHVSVLESSLVKCAAAASNNLLVHHAVRIAGPSVRVERLVGRQAHHAQALHGTVPAG